MKEKISKSDRMTDKKNLGMSGHHKKIAHHLDKAHGYLSKMASAGHKYNDSAKHRKAESKSMKDK